MYNAVKYIYILGRSMLQKPGRAKIDDMKMSNEVYLLTY